MSRLRLLLALAIFTTPTFLRAQDAPTPSPAESQQSESVPDKADHDRPVKASQLLHPILWHDPGEIGSLDLFNGPGGTDDVPSPPFKFLDEDMNGTNPKMDVRDANDKKWRVKLGAEARPEVVATRLLWAMGFYTNNDYVLPSATIDGMSMKRGKKEIGENGQITDARFARKPGGEKKIGIWTWKDNPFAGTREFNGLRVMMAVMNSWDLKDVNNAVYNDKDTHQQVFLVSDIGATFATNSITLPISHSKGDVSSYEKSKFIQKVHDDKVDFATPKKPTGMLLMTFGMTAKEYANRASFDWIGNDIPVADARWMGQQLSKLSHQQLVDAFRAGHFSPDEIDLYVTIVESRIAELQSL